MSLWEPRLKDCLAKITAGASKEKNLYHQNQHDSQASFGLYMVQEKAVFPHDYIVRSSNLQALVLQKSRIKPFSVELVAAGED